MSDKIITSGPKHDYLVEGGGPLVTIKRCLLGGGGDPPVRRGGGDGGRDPPVGRVVGEGTHR